MRTYLTWRFRSRVSYRNILLVRAWFQMYCLFFVFFSFLFLFKFYHAFWPLVRCSKENELSCWARNAKVASAWSRSRCGECEHANTLKSLEQRAWLSKRSAATNSNLVHSLTWEIALKKKTRECCFVALRTGNWSRPRFVPRMYN